MNILEKIIESLSCFLDDYTHTREGLLYDKMGISIFLFHYAAYCKEEYWEEKAFGLIGHILENIDTSTLVWYNSGLSGIGCGIEYLIKKKFLENEGSEVLSDLDTQILKELSSYEAFDFSLETGLIGIGRYLTYRLMGEKNPHSINAMQKKMELIQLIDRLDYHKAKLIKSKDTILFLRVMQKLHIMDWKVNRLLKFVTLNNEDESAYTYADLLYTTHFNQNIHFFREAVKNIEKVTEPGIKNGLCGIGMYQLMKAGSTDKEWINLL